MSVMYMVPFMLIVYTLIISLVAGWYTRKYKRKKKKLDVTINRIKDAVISVDNNGRYNFLNDAALATHPLGRKKTLGRIIWDVHPESVGTEFYQLYQLALTTGTLAEAESYYAAIDKWFYVKIYPSETGLTIFYHDITESKKNRIELIRSEEKYRTLFYKSPLPAWLYDVESLRFIDVNEAAVKHYGYTRSEFLGMTIKDIRPQEDVAALLQDIAQVQRDSHSSRFSRWRHRKKTGEVLVVETTAHSFSKEKQNLRLVIVNDITQKVVMERQLLDNQAMLKEAQAIGRIGYWDVDLQTGFHTWSEELCKILGFTAAEAKPSTGQFLALLHPDDKIKAEDIIKQALDNYTESKSDFRFFTTKGEKRYGYIEWRFVYNEVEVPVRLFGIMQDITERKLAEEHSRFLEIKIKEQKIQAQRKISKAIIKVQEQYKNYVAQELHDNINQILFGAKFYLGIAGRKDERVRAMVKDPAELVSKAMDEIHLLCQNLTTPLKDIDLYEIIHDLVQKSANGPGTSLHIDLHYEINCRLTDELKLNIYRIIQEQLHNVRKHAEAKNVRIRLAVKEGCVYIMLEDDGKGFDVKIKRKGLGLTNIQHRVEAFNGRMSIRSNPGLGYQSEILIPIELND